MQKNNILKSADKKIQFLKKRMILFYIYIKAIFS